MNNIPQSNRRLGTLSLPKIQELLLCFYIILAPSYKCLEFTVFGYNIIIMAIGLLLASYIVNLPRMMANGRNRFFSLVVLPVFFLQLFFAKSQSNIGMVLGITLFAFMLQTDTRIRIEKIYYAFVISVVVAAIFSVLRGVTGSGIVRVAKQVDGSIATIGMAIALFAETDKLNIKQSRWKTLRIMAGVSALVVLAFGMSRARTLIILLIMAVFFLIKMRASLIKRLRVTYSGLLAIFLVLAAVLAVLTVPALRAAVMPLWNRFINEGLSSEGRDVEMEFGWNLFKQNVWRGAGWGDFELVDQNNSLVAYNNHCAYVAVLARGGLMMAIPVALAIGSLLKNAIRIRKENSFALILVVILLFLSYGNAGILNYTICSIIPLVVLSIKKEMYG